MLPAVGRPSDRDTTATTGGAVLSVTVDRNSPIPLYFQIAQQMEQAIEDGALEAGARLDNEIELADRLAVSRPTMRKAIERLVARGLVVRRRGVGTVVVPRSVKRPIALTSLQDDLLEAGRLPSTEVLSLSRQAAGARLAPILAVSEQATVVAIERLRYADAAPLAVMRNYLPDGLLPLDAEALRHEGLYQLLRRAGLAPQVANQTIGARPATPSEVRLLGTHRSATVLTMTRTAYDSAGRVLEYGNHAYLAERYSFEMSLVAR